MRSHDNLNNGIFFDDFTSVGLYNCTDNFPYSQSVAMLENLCTKRRIRGPFLVVAPVSTLCHWQREIESLTDMNCVVYTGNQEDRQIIRNHEFYYSDGNSCELKFNVSQPLRI